MTEKSKLVESMQRIFNKRGRLALCKAKTEICSRFPKDDDVSRALRYFAEVTLRDVLPVFPALISISCEAVGGEAERTTSVGGAIILIAGAADIHDDVIDQSLAKGAKPTVFGKFGKEVAILAGDVLLAVGLAWLQKECEKISKEQGGKILDIMEQAIVDISQAEAQETRMRAEKDLSAEAYSDALDLKAVVPELNMRIGAILGNGSAENVKTLGHFGRIFGIVSTVAEEFMDLLELAELQNRLRNDNPPLPLLQALQNPSVKTQIMSIKGKSLTNKDLREIRRLVLSSPEADKLKRNMSVLVQAETAKISSAVSDKKVSRELKTLITASLELLQGIGC